MGELKRGVKRKYGAKEAVFRYKEGDIPTKGTSAKKAGL